MANCAGLYLHIPFCASKCAYCDFYSLPQATAQAMDDYTDALISHMEDWQSSALFDTVYLGGGTPSLLGGTRLTRILRAVRDKFALAQDTEITVECNPDSMDTALLQSLRRVGVNRLSLGIQSAHDTQLQRLGRRHSFAQAVEAVHRAQDCGFDNISLDLMYGLPNQTQADFLQSVDAVLALHPQHLSCYGLKLEAGTPLALQNPVLPDDDAQADMYLALCDRLTQAGFDQYEISNWAKDGKISRHNVKYWDLTPYLGIGCGAHSLWQGKRFAYARSLSDFLQCAPVQEEQTLPDFSSTDEFLMLALRTSKGLDLVQFSQKYQLSAQAHARLLAQFDQLVTHQLAQSTAHGFALTPQGFLVSNAIICALQDCIS